MRLPNWRLVTRGGPAAWVFALALVARLLHLTLLYAFRPELIDHPVVDAGYYHAWALDLLNGGGLAEEPFYMHPVLPYLTAAVYAVTGPEPLVMGGLQSVLGALSAVFLLQLCRRWFDERVALAAALVMALYRPLIVNAALLETNEIAIFLLLASLLLVVTAPEHPGRRALRLLAGGLAFALAFLARGNLLLVVPAPFVALALQGQGRGRRLRDAAALGAGMLVVVGAVGARQHLVAHEALWLTSSSGPNLYLCNHAGNTTGGHIAPPFVTGDPRLEAAEYRAEAERISGHRMSAAATSAFWRWRAMDECAAHPSLAAARFGRKLALAFSGYEVPDNYNLPYLASLTPLGRVPLPGFPWIVGLGVLGLGLSWSQRRRLVLPYLVLGLYLLSLGIFCVWSRVRIPLVPFLLPFAAQAAFWLREQARARRIGRTSLAIAAVLVLTSASLLLWPRHLRQLEWAQALANHATALDRAGQPEEAAALRARATALDPDNPLLLVNTGAAALRSGKIGAAVAACRHAAAVRPSLVEAHDCLGVALASTGDMTGAEAALRRATALSTRADRGFNLAILLGRQGRVDEARLLIEAIVARDPEHAGARRALELLPPR